MNEEKAPIKDVPSQFFSEFQLLVDLNIRIKVLARELKRVYILQNGSP